MRNRMTAVKKFFKRFPWRALLPASLILVSGGWLADGLKGEILFTDWAWKWGPRDRWVGLAFAGFCFVGATLWLYHYRRHFALVRSLSRHESNRDPHKVLILFVSLLQSHRPVFNKTELKDLELNGKPCGLTLSGTCLDNDIKELDKIRWNWQQLLRAVKPHEKTLERLHLIGSPASYGNLGDCKKMLAGYLGTKVDIFTERKKGKINVDNKVDFEDFDELLACLRGIISDEKEKKGFGDRDIIIDVTGGQKTTSIAGAIITFNSRVTFQYVQTFVSPGETPKVYAYDVDYQPPE